MESYNLNNQKYGYNIPVVVEYYDDRLVRRNNNNVNELVKIYDINKDKKIYIICKPNDILYIE